MKKILIPSFVIILVAVVIGFQNCGKKLTNVTSFEDNSSIEPEPIKVSEPPNILMILLDDAGQEDYLDPEIAPNIAALRKESIHFPYFYVTPMCTPTRISYLSGRYPIDYDIFWVCGSNALYGIPNSDATIPQSLQQRGYATSAFGKWHAGVSEVDVGNAPDTYKEFDIKNKFQYYVVSPGVVSDGYFDPIMNVNGVETPFTNSHLEDVTGKMVYDQIVKLKNAPTKSPFYLQYWLNAPHAVQQPSLRMISDAGFRAQYRKCVIEPVPKADRAACTQWKNENKRQIYNLLLKQADENIGKVLDLFKTTDPYLENTVILLTSDNGGTNGVRPIEPAYGNKDYLGRDLRGFKTDLFEGGIRQNLLVKMPGQTTARIDTSFVANIDLFPTLIDLAQSTPTELEKNQFDGQSFYQKLMDPKASFARSKPFFWSFKVQNEIDDITAVRDPVTGEIVELYDQTGYAVRKGQWKLVSAPLLEHGCKPCLFDMSSGYSRESNGKDGSPSDDVASLHPEVIEELREDYIEWLLSSTQLKVSVQNKSAGAQSSLEEIIGFEQNTKESVPSFQLSNASGKDWIALQNHQNFDVNRLDFTFSAQITPQVLLSKTQVIATRAGTWVFQLNANSELEVITYSTTAVPTTVTTNFKLIAGKTYDVAFVIYAFKGANSVISIFAAERESDSTNPERLVKLVRAETSKGLQSNKETILIGVKPNPDVVSFIGAVNNVRLYKAPLSRNEIGYGMRRWGNVRQ